jgi:hypothetical protein
MSAHSGVLTTASGSVLMDFPSDTRPIRVTQFGFRFPKRQGSCHGSVGSFRNA